MDPTVETTPMKVQVLFGERMGIFAPFSTAFKTALKAAIPKTERTWVRNHWEIDLKHRILVKDLIQVHYGESL